MDSFALVYFTDDKSYGAVAITSFKNGDGQSFTEGSKVTVLGSSFDPRANSPRDEEWSAKVVKLGKLILIIVFHSFVFNAIQLLGIRIISLLSSALTLGRADLCLNTFHSQLLPLYYTVGFYNDLSLVI